MFTDPVKNLKQFDLKENMIVADLGAGTGFYSIAASRMVPGGKVYAIEIVPDYLETVRNKIKEAKITNVECLIGDIEKIGGTHIKDHTIHRAIASNILFQLEDKEKFIDEVKRILAPSGKILLVDWSNESNSVLPGQKGALTKNEARELFEKAGFLFEHDIEAGAHHYGMIFINK